MATKKEQTERAVELFLLIPVRKQGKIIPIHSLAEFDESAARQLIAGGDARVPTQEDRDDVAARQKAADEAALVAAGEADAAAAEAAESRAAAAQAEAEAKAASEQSGEASEAARAAAAAAAEKTETAKGKAAKAARS